MATVLAKSTKDYGVDFSEISASNERHIRNWQWGMDTARLDIDNATLKREFLVWAEVNELEGVEHFAALPEHRFLTIGRMAWLMNNGAEIPENSAAFLYKQIEQLKTLAPEAVEAKEDDGNIPLTNDARKIIQYVNLYSYIDAVVVKHVDELDQIEELVHTRIKDFAPPMAQLRKLFAHYKENLDDALNERENELVLATIEPLATVVNVLAACTGNAKAIAAVKKKVGNRAAKAASKASVKIVDADTNIVGLSPVLLVGNNAALVYNTKNRKAMLYVAKDGETLSVKGTYITGYDEQASFGKTLRKPKEQFTKILAGVVNVKRLTQVLGDYIAGKRHDLNGKLNKETLIIKVFK